MIGFTPVKSTFGSIQQVAEFEMARFGLAYYTETLDEPDVTKLWHYVRSDRTGQWYDVSFTPYGRMTQDDLFELANMIGQVEEYEFMQACACEFD
jgi:hypothetical protein